jgi:hypothetical protein
MQTPLSRVELFSQAERVDRRPAMYGESAYRFLDRVSSAYFSEVRELMQRWLDIFPPEGQEPVAARFQQDDDSQHLAAFWELYVHACLHGRAEIRYEPALEHTEKRPDFEVATEDDRFYLRGDRCHGGVC